MRNAVFLVATLGVLVVIVGSAVLLLPSTLGNRTSTTYDSNSPVGLSSTQDTQSSSSTSSSTSSSSYCSSGTSVSSFSTDLLVNTLYGGQRADNFAFGPGNGTLYITDENSGIVYAINTTGYPLANITVGQYPQDIIYAPQLRTFYVTTLNSVLAINATTNTVYQTITAGFYPFSLLYVPAESELYVGFASNMTAIINVSNGQLIRTINNTVVPLSIVYDTANNLVYEDNWTSTLIFDPRTNQIIATIPSVSGTMLYDSNNDRIYIGDFSGNYNGSMFELNPSTNQVISLFNVSSNIGDMTFDSQNKHIYFLTGSLTHIGEFSDLEKKLDSIMVLQGGFARHIKYNPVDNLLFATTYPYNDIDVYSPSFNQSNTVRTIIVSCNSATMSNFTSNSGETQIVFYIEVSYKGSWNGSYSFGPAGDSQTTTEFFSGNGFKNQSVMFQGYVNDGLCVSASVRKQDNSDSEISLQTYSPTYNTGSYNQTSVPFGIITTNFCVIP